MKWLRLAYRLGGFASGTPDDALFTPAEAAVLTRLSLKAVNNATDKNLVPTSVRPR